MHEFSLATQIVENVLEFAEKHHPGEILQVRLQIGELTCVEAEQLRFCCHSITQKTLMENAELAIEVVPALIRCPHCRYEGSPKYWKGALATTAIPTLQCPQCGETAKATQGHECEIRSVQFVNALPAEKAA